MRSIILASFLFGTLGSSDAFADIGIPMIFITFPWMLLAFVPVCILESTMLNRQLKISERRSMKISLIANLVSTLVGIPLTWILLVLLQMLTGGGGALGLESIPKKLLAVTWQAAWLIPYESHLRWMIPSAGLVLLVPFFFASWLIEYQIVKKMIMEIVPREVKRSVFWANLLSYSILAFIVIIFLLRSL